MMKRLFLTVVAALSMTATFAENENADRVNATETYDMSINIRRLGETLGLTLDQLQTVTDIHSWFCSEMQTAAQAGKDDRQALVEAAVSRDLKYMSYILTPVQYEKYSILLNTTLDNRGLK